jgi:molybdenum cofactor biosynthesis enzyme
MAKAVDKEMVVDGVRLLEKTKETVVGSTEADQ